jgi:hypothetical protein
MTGEEGLNLKRAGGSDDAVALSGSGGAAAQAGQETGKRQPRGGLSGCWSRAFLVVDERGKMPTVAA